MAEETAADPIAIITVGNYGYYNEGELRDKAITLPVSESELHQFLIDNGLKDADHEEIYISDVLESSPEFNALGWSFCQNNADPFAANLLAAFIQENPDEAERAANFLEATGESTYSITEVCNYIAQADELEMDIIDTSVRFSDGTTYDMKPAQAIGEYYADVYGLFSDLSENHPLVEYFDYESYGQSFIDNESVGEGIVKGTVVVVPSCCDYPDVDYYSLDELREQVEDVIQHKEYVDMLASESGRADLAKSTFKPIQPDDKPSLAADIASAKSASKTYAKSAPTQSKVREGR